MELQGKLVYDPVAKAKGKTRKRILRRHIQLLHVCTRAYTPFLTGRLRKIANKYDRLLHDDPNYWIRSKGKVATERELDTLYSFATDLHRMDFFEVPKAIQTLLQTTLCTIADSLIITRMDPWWAILAIPFKTITPWFQDVYEQDGVKLSQSTWGPHISIVRGESRASRSRWGSRENDRFTVQVREEFKSNGRGYYWLPCQSLELEELRINLGLSPRPLKPFHLTLGKAS